MGTKLKHVAVLLLSLSCLQFAIAFPSAENLLRLSRRTVQKSDEHAAAFKLRETLLAIETKRSVVNPLAKPIDGMYILAFTSVHKEISC
jgi:hypothetical protein